MPMQINALQRKAIQLLYNRMQHYIDLRRQVVVRLNPKIESVWDDLCWQQLQKYHAVIATDKAWGPIRFVVAELLLSDEEKKIYELFNPKSQYSLLGELVDEKEGDAHRTAGILEVHDMRSMIRAIDPIFETMITLIQTFIWWDLPDAVLISRFEWKAERVIHFEQKGVTPEISRYYRNVMKLEDKMPDADDIIRYECERMKQTVKEFIGRRQTDRAHQVILLRETNQSEHPDMIIEATASQLNMLKNLKNGNGLDDAAKAKFAGAMNCPAEKVTQEGAMRFLETTVALNKKRLKSALSGAGSGEPYNAKDRQLEDLKKQLDKITGKWLAPAEGPLSAIVPLPSEEEAIPPPEPQS